MMAQRSILALCFQFSGSVFIQSTKINGERNVLPCSKMAFSDVIESVIFKNVSEGKPRDPHLPPVSL